MQHGSKEASESSSNESRCIYVFLFVKKPDKCPVLPMLQSCNDIYVTVSYNMEELDYEWHNILIIPGGTASQQLVDMGEVGVKRVKDFVAAGGGYVGICAGAYLASWHPKIQVGLKLLPICYSFAVGKEHLPVKVEGTITIRTSTGLAKDCRYQTGPMYPIQELCLSKKEAELKEEDPNYNTNIELLAFVDEGIPRYRKTMNGCVVILRGQYGKGKVLSISPHPESNKDHWDYVLHLIFDCVNKDQVI